MATTAALSENSRQGINTQIPPRIGLEACLSPNPRWGCGHAYDETAVGLVVYVRNDPVNRIDPDGKEDQHVISDWGGGWWAEDYYWEDEEGHSGADHYFGYIAPRESDDPFVSRRAIMADPVDEGGGDDPAGIDYCSSNPTNDRAKAYFNSHLADAQKMAKDVGMPYEVILAVAAAETTWGSEGIFKPTNNWFGLHVNNEKDTNRYANQTGTFKATQDGWVATFADASGFYDSGMAFAKAKAGQLIKGMTLDDSLKIAGTLHVNGYGTTNQGYVALFTGVLNRVIGTSKCPAR